MRKRRPWIVLGALVGAVVLVALAAAFRAGEGSQPGYSGG